MTKPTYESLKCAIRELNEEHEKKVNEHIGTYFVIGMITGLILSYVNIFSIIVGVGVGITIGKRIPIKVNAQFRNLVNQISEQVKNRSL